ncbi:2'-5' RNA ligase family protein [Photobacterium profundum]|uniref:2'-5' RNA ligase family protein n=1 Tax=Photobacterium profundum TaxID=74109 RepID=UPI003D11C416
MSDITEKLFFALGLPPITDEKNDCNLKSYQQLCQLKNTVAAEMQGKPILNNNLHITLVFLGAVKQQQKQRLITNVNQLIAPQAFSVSCSELHYWPRSQVIWLDCHAYHPVHQQRHQQPSTSLQTLVCLLQQAAIHVTSDAVSNQASGYIPHITLCKKVTSRPHLSPLPQQLDFHFQHFGLYISETIKTAHGSGVQYRCLQQWSLAAAHINN